jgi:hypothetical protein
MEVEKKVLITGAGRGIALVPGVQGVGIYFFDPRNTSKNTRF